MAPVSAPFEVVLDEHGSIVLRVLQRLLGRTDADDAWQETFLSALRAYPRLRPDSDVRAWLLTIAHRKAIDRFRSRAREPRPAEGVEPAVPVSEPDVDDDVWRRVRALPTKQRLALGFRFGADLSYADIAARLDCSEPAARRSVHEGLRTLRRQLAADPIPT
ncbi:MAG: RNA polymerase sigma factor [Ilumatobacteraceae bacterium]